MKKICLFFLVFTSSAFGDVKCIDELNELKASISFHNKLELAMINFLDDTLSYTKDIGQKSLGGSGERVQGYELSKIVFRQGMDASRDMRKKSASAQEDSLKNLDLLINCLK